MACATHEDGAGMKKAVNELHLGVGIYCINSCSLHLFLVIFPVINYLQDGSNMNTR